MNNKYVFYLALAVILILVVIALAEQSSKINRLEGSLATANKKLNRLDQNTGQVRLALATMIVHQQQSQELASLEFLDREPIGFKQSL